MKTFGANLVEAREKLGISQKQLAELLGITATRLNYWEKDKRQPDIEMIKKIAEILKTSPSDLLGWDEKYNPNGKLADEVLELELLENFNKLNDSGKQKVKEYLSDLLEIEIYRNKEK